MLKALAITLLSCFLIVGADYAGTNGLSIWLGIPLTIGYVYMLAILVRYFIKNR